MLPAEQCCEIHAFRQRTVEVDEPLAQRTARTRPVRHCSPDKYRVRFRQQAISNHAVPVRGAEAGLNHEDGLRVMWIVPREPPVLDNGAAPAVVVIAADDFPDEVIIAAHERLAYEPVEPDGVVLLDRAPLLRR